jgi:voltage-gated potassium channel
LGRLSSLVRFAIAFLLLLLLVAVGTAGYRVVEGWSMRDSLFMTFITFTTVGYNEVHPLSPSGQAFTIVFLILSIGTVGYSVTVLIDFIFEGQILQAVKERRMRRAKRRLREHYILCGAGDIGRQVAQEFQRSRVHFVVVDKDPASSELARDESVLFIQGDAAEEETLLEAGIERARGLVSALPEDEANVFVVLTARQLNPKLFIVSQAADERAVSKLRKTGADRVISPKLIAGRRMASLALRPSLMNFLDVIVEGEELGMRVEEVPVQPGSPLSGKSLRESGIGQHTGAIIVGINAPDGRLRLNPSATSTLSSAVLGEGDVLIALGSEEQLQRLREFARRGR